MRLHIITLMILIGATAGTAEGDELSLLGEFQRHDIRVTSFCVEGHIVLVAHSDVGKGGGLQMMQLQHEVNGEIKPMQCKSEPSSVSKTSSDKKSDPDKK